MKKTRLVLRSCQIITGLAAVISFASASRCQAQSALVLANSNAQTYGLPNDLQVVLETELPDDATDFSLQHWQDWPPSPANWCAGRTDVTYYLSPSLGLGKIIVADPALDGALRGRTMDADGPPAPGDGGSDDGTNGVSGGPRLFGLHPPPGYQPGEVGLGLPGVYVIEWNGTGFTTRTILLGRLLGDPTYSLEKATFAPIDIPVASR